MAKLTKAQERAEQEAKKKKLARLFEQYRDEDRLTTCQFLQQLVREGFCTAGDLKTKFNKSAKEIEACVRSSRKTGIPNATREKGIREILALYEIPYRPSTHGDKSYRPRKGRRPEESRQEMRA